MENITKWLARPIKPFSITEVSEFSACIGTTVGNVRPDNQDRAIIARFTSARRRDDSFVCFAVCDGMGGMADGGHCAEIALSTFLLGLTREDRKTTSEKIHTASKAANTEVFRQYRERGGSTLASVVIFPQSAAGISVGDTRIYAVNNSNNLKQVSIDDTIAGELNKMKGLSGSQGQWDAFAGQLTQFIGIGEGMEPRMYQVNKNSTHLLTSDGVHSMNTDTLNSLVSSGGTARAIVPRLLQVSRWCGGNDNATAIWVSPWDASWFESPAWSEGDWLEIWDAAGKLEISVEPLLNSQPKPGKTEKVTTKPKRARKQGSSKRNTVPVSVGISAPHEHSAQGTLKIEIEGETPQDDDSDPNLPSDQPAKSTGPRDDPTTKRE